MRLTVRDEAGRVETIVVARSLRESSQLLVGEAVEPGLIWSMVWVRVMILSKQKSRP